MRKILVVTGTRAEYGVLKNLMNKIKNNDELQLHIIATGSHLSEKYGKTINEIISDGFLVDKEIDILLENRDNTSTAKEMARAMEKFSDAYDEIKPDILLIVGDRYEIFSAAATAMAMNIPIAHISGGEITEGAMDDQIRHAITKMAHIHFPGTEIYGNNIKRMGEEAWRVFNVGDPGIENIRLTTLLSQDKLKKDLGVQVDEETLLVTYHPVTLEKGDVLRQITNLIEALKRLNNKFIITYPNSDNGGDIIIKALEDFKEECPERVYLFKNLGSLRYLSVMKLCAAVIGNSSSALIEAPFLKKPVVNIGNRQKGRLKADNIIDTDYDIESIFKGITYALSVEFRERVLNTVSLYGDGNTSEDIIRVLKSIELGEKLLKKKLIWDF